MTKGADMNATVQPITIERARELAAPWHWYESFRAVADGTIGVGFVGYDDLLADIEDALAGLLDTAGAVAARSDLGELRRWAEASQMSASPVIAYVNITDAEGVLIDRIEIVDLGECYPADTKDGTVDYRDLSAEPIIDAVEFVRRGGTP